MERRKNEMNIYEKLQKMRVELQQKNIKKTGRNTYAKYDYFELADILPHINELQEKHKTCSFISFDREIAKLTILNSEKPEEHIEFTIPMATLDLKGANEVQNLGGAQTYSRRYLYLNAFEIVENDLFDAIQCKPTKIDKVKQNVKESDNSNELEVKKKTINTLISKYKEVSGKQTKEITDMLSRKIGKDLKEISLTEATYLLAYLNDLISEVEV